jgi:hypothetical protein
MLLPGPILVEEGEKNQKHKKSNCQLLYEMANFGLLFLYSESESKSGELQ